MSTNHGTKRHPARLFALAVSLIVACCAGCGGGDKPDTTLVKGKVTYGGQPVTQGTVTFLPVQPAEGYPSRPASAIIQPDGSYQLGSFESGDGVVPGEYQVAIVSTTGGPSPEEPDAVEQWHIPQRYGNAAESKLTASIPTGAKGTLEINFDLTD